MTRRRQATLLEAVLTAFFELPLPVSVVGAIVFFLVLRFAGPAMAGSSMTAKVFSQVEIMIAPWVAGTLLLAGIAGFIKRQGTRLAASRRRVAFPDRGLLKVEPLANSAGQTAVAGKNWPGVRDLTWQQFETAVAEAYEGQGFVVTRRGGIQPDGGIDLELRKGPERVIVQCKHWLNREVGVRPVRELFGVLTAEGADRGILVATNGFTMFARTFALRVGIEMVDSQKLISPAAKTKPEPSVVPNAGPALAAVAPTCPRCSKPMVLRTARRGQQTGSSFWGCSTFPECRKTLAA